MATARRRPARLLAWALVMAGGMFVLLELGLRVAVALDLSSLPEPKPASTYWDGAHPRFGFWRHPDAETRHRFRCLDNVYRSNAVGARDRERERRSEAPRVVVLGDSFADGWGVPREQRFSDVLEARTGIEHLNFAMPHFSPYQQVLVYEGLAKDYDHETVIATVYPGNDFIDLDAGMPGWAANYEYRYRPYLVPDGDGFRRLDVREPGWLRWSRHHTVLYTALDRLRLRLAPPPALDPEAHRWDDEHIGSYFYDFPEPGYTLLEHALGLLDDAVGERRLVLALLPNAADLARFARDGEAPLSERLANFAADHGITLVDLLPTMAAQPGDLARFFHPCDFHWNARGQHFAARAIALRLVGEAYPRPANARPANAAKP